MSTFYHAVTVKRHRILIVLRNFVVIVIKYRIVMSELYRFYCIQFYVLTIDRTCHKLHAQEHKNYCGFRSSENYEIIGIPFKKD